MPTDSKLDLTCGRSGWPLTDVSGVRGVTVSTNLASDSAHPARERAVEAARDGHVQLLRSGSGDDEAAGSLPRRFPLMPPSPASLAPLPSTLASAPVP